MTKHQTKSTCELHNKKMKKTLVGASYGLTFYGNKKEYPNAKNRKNMGCIKGSWPYKRLALIYHCSSCNKIKRLTKEKVEIPF
jgi:hypothetical protein